MERVIFTATPALIYRIRQDFPQCIECGEDHLSTREQYFHAANCRRGAGLEMDELTRRMNARYLVAKTADCNAGMKRLLVRLCFSPTTSAEEVGHYRGCQMRVRLWRMLSAPSESRQVPNSSSAGIRTSDCVRT